VWRGDSHYGRVEAMEWAESSGEDYIFDWNVFLGHAAATLAKFQVPEAEQREVVAFVQSLKKECVE
jgi:hypothetical protein